MKHLMSPLDLSVEELEEILNLANDIEKILRNTHMPVMARNWQLCSMNPAPVPVSALKQLC